MRLSGIALLLAALLAGCGGEDDEAASTLPFAPMTDATLHDPDNPTKIFRVDFARVEALYPLSRDDLMSLTPAALAGMSQEEIDQVYARLTAGPMPDGFYASDLFLAEGGSLHERFDEIAGVIPGRLAAASVERLVGLASFVWKGKVFDAASGIARTPIEDLTPLSPFVDGAVASGTIPRRGPLRFILPANRVWLLFPAKVYCGQSLLDGRRESLIVDYNYADELEGYLPHPDALLIRTGLALRDEMRMVRPGLYLGRAYAGKVFVLNFTLYNPRIAGRDSDGFAAGGPVDEACWPGEQERRMGATR